MDSSTYMQQYIELCGPSICYSIVRNLTYIEHIHNSFELIYVLDGTIETKVSGQRLSLGSGDLLFISNDRIHSYVSSRSSTAIVIAVAPEEVPQFTALLKEHPIPFCHLKGAQDNKLITECFRILTSSNAQSMNRIAVAGYIDLLLSEFVSPIRQADPVQAAQPTSLTKALRYIYDTIPTPASSDDVALNVGVSYYHLSRLFNRSIGINLSTYCSLINILIARRMLVQTPLSVDDIRQRCGYTNLRSFDRDFARFTGMSPREYRAKNQSGGLVDYDIPFVREMLLKQWNLTL